MLRARLWTAAAGLLIVALALEVWRLAWLCDDAYITLRTAENWLAGYGPTWNIAERTQTFTHPLWLVLLTLARALGGEAYFATLALCGALSLATALLLCRCARGGAAAVAVVAVLAASRSFTEFATAGLENPLAHVLLVLLAAAYAGDRAPAARALRVALLAGLLGITRLDLLLLCAPVLLAAIARAPRRQALLHTSLGLLPVLAWAAFATVYYGSPLPTTAYAKLVATGVPARELMRQGLFYFGYVAAWDPVTVVAIAAGTALGLLLPALRSRALALGILLHCVYVVRIGGDFMAGRFCTPAFVLATAILARALAPARWPWPLLVAAAALALQWLPGPPPWLAAPADDQGMPPVPERGVIDERLFWYGKLGLLSHERQLPVPGVYSAVLRVDGRTARVVLPGGMAGCLAYEGGDLVHVVDPWLCDPLLMRLPLGAPEHWRIGHFLRRLPEGYLESVASGENRIYHPGLRRYYGALRAAVREPVWSAHRWRELWRLWRGAYDADLAQFVAEDYRQPPRVSVDAAELATPVGDGTLWFDDPRVRVVYAGGLELLLPAPVRCRRVRAAVIPGLVYELRFCRAGSEQGRVRLDAERLNPSPRPQEHLRGFMGVYEFTADVDETVGEIDAVWIDAAPSPTRIAAIGGLVLVP